MKLIQPKVELWDKKEDEMEIQFIERIGRVCYKSEDKITEDGSSAEKLVGNMFVRNGHEAVLEHYAYIFELDDGQFDEISETFSELENKYGYILFINRTTHTDRNLISGNVRAFRDFFKYVIFRGIPVPIWFTSALFTGSKDREVLFGDLMKEVPEGMLTCKSPMKEVRREDLSHLEQYYHYYQTVWFRCDRGVTHEIVRHRPASYAQESTRYCNYSLGKFDRSCSFIDISGGMELDRKVNNLDEDTKEMIKDVYIRTCNYLDEQYKNLIELGVTPQIARDILPNGLKTELVMTANLREWIHFLNLRTASTAHPQMREIAMRVESLFNDKFDMDYIPHLPGVM